MAEPSTKICSKEADDQETNQSSTSTTETPSLNFEQLSIDDDKIPLELLGDPDDYNIQVTTGDKNPYTSANTFEDLSLTKELLKGLHGEMKFKNPSKIQAIRLPMILNPPYRDLRAQAHNGSGKTTCFVLGMLRRVDPKVHAPQALCICPTRELAIQNIEVLRKMGKYTKISSECAVPIKDATPIRKRPLVMAQVVIGTPGTIKSWITATKLGVNRLKILVFDEADQMLAEDGFKDD